MRNFNYNVANQGMLDGCRVIALKNSDLEKLANAANMKEPEISVTPETVVEPEPTIKEQTVQDVPNTQNIPNETVPNVEVKNEPTTTYNEQVAPVTPAAPETTSVNAGDINIPDPVVTPQPTVTQSYAAPQQDPVVNDGNIFDAPVVRENTDPKPAVQQEMTQSSVESGVVDLDEFMIKSQEIYDRTKSAVEEVLLKSQREQMNLAMQMMKNLQQLKADNAAYSSAIDQVVNDASFKKVA